LGYFLKPKEGGKKKEIEGWVPVEQEGNV